MKVAIVTGASSGIGKALSLELHSRDIRVVAAARRIEAMRALEEQGMEIEAVDLANPRSIDAFAERVLARHERVDLLVNNAGYGLMAPALDIAPGDLAAQFQTNVFGPVQLIQRIAPAMKAQGHGTIVNVGSVSGVLATPFAGAYCASKAAFHAISDSLRMELDPFGIHVVTVQPGAVQSDFGRAATAAAEAALREDSWYKPLEQAIRDRANSSQDGATPVADFARHVVDQVLKRSPKPTVRYGKLSFLMPFLNRWVPTATVDRMLSKKFGLHKLSG